MRFAEEDILWEIVSERTEEVDCDLKPITKVLRRRCGRFSDTEAILHMMDALIVEATGRRGW